MAGVPLPQQGPAGLDENCECLQAISNPNLEILKPYFNGRVQNLNFFFNGREDAATGWMDALEIPLRQPCSCGQLDIVKKLILDEMTRPEQIRHETPEDIDYRQRLALDLAAGSGNLKIIKGLRDTNNELLAHQEDSVPYGLVIPVVRASNAGHREVTRYLYNIHKEKLRPVLMDNDGCWAICLLLDAIFYGFTDIALDIFDQVLRENGPILAVTKQLHQRSAPLRVLALKPELFRSPYDLGFWHRLIYSCLFWKTRQGFPKWFGPSNAHRLLEKICTQTRQIADDVIWKETAYEALLEAVENGNKEFFVEIIKCDRQLLWILEANSGRNLFQLAVKFKKENIFNLIHGLDGIKVTLLRSIDNANNNILHIAAGLSTPDQLSKISGAALKMQRDAQWFNEVKSLVSEREVVQKNNDNKTPRQVFEESHEPLRKEGEEWMKYTATACSFVAALIATVTFQAIFTEPGGTDETSGKPLLLNDGHFMAFIIIDSLAFYASCVSVLIFLSILTSRYSFDDFIVSLPRKMIFGLSILFFSIAAMLVAFITAVSASMRAKRILAVPLKPLASLPAILFLMLQYPLLKEMISSTYGKRFFHRDTKCWLDLDVTQGSGQNQQAGAV